MDIDDAAKILKELGHPHRLRIFKRLVKAGFEGLPVGALREELDIPKFFHDPSCGSSCGGRTDCPGTAGTHSAVCAAIWTSLAGNLFPARGMLP